MTLFGINENGTSHLEATGDYSPSERMPLPSRQQTGHAPSDAGIANLGLCGRATLNPEILL